MPAKTFSNAKSVCLMAYSYTLVDRHCYVVRLVWFYCSTLTDLHITWAIAIPSSNFSPLLICWFSSCMYECCGHTYIKGVHMTGKYNAHTEIFSWHLSNMCWYNVLYLFCVVQWYDDVIICCSRRLDSIKLLQIGYGRWHRHIHSRSKGEASSGKGNLR